MNIDKITVTKTLSLDLKWRHYAFLGAAILWVLLIMLFPTILEMWTKP